MLAVIHLCVCNICVRPFPVRMPVNPCTSVRIVLNDVSQHCCSSRRGLAILYINIINAPALLIRHGPSERCERQGRTKTNQSGQRLRRYRIILCIIMLSLSSLLCVCVCAVAWPGFRNGGGGKSKKKNKCSTINNSNLFCVTIIVST